METRVVLGHIELHCTQHYVILNHWESSLLRARKSDMQMWEDRVCAIRQLSSSSRWLRPQDSLQDIIEEEEGSREGTVQEDENKVDEMKRDVEEIRSRHADDMTNEHERKTLFSLSHYAWSSSPHEKLTM